MQEVQRTCKAGDAYGACIAYNLTPPLLAYHGLCANLYDQAYLDLSAPWWPKEYNEQMILNNTLYTLTEACGYGLLSNMVCIYFNSTLVEGRKLESPFDLVENNEWKLDKMTEQIKDVYSDLNSDGKRDDGDFYGLCSSSNARWDAWFFAFGNRYTERNAEGELVALYDSPYIVEFVDDMKELLGQEGVFPYDTAKNMYRMFNEQRVLYYITTVYHSEKMVKSDLDIVYGVVPLPMWDEYQTRYYTHVANTYDTWCVPYNAKSVEQATAMIECMASESYRLVDPVYFENNVKTRYAPDPRMGKMYDLIRDSVVFDFGYLFRVVFNNAGVDVQKMVKYSFLENRNWEQQYASNRAGINAAFQKVVDIFYGKFA